MVYNRVAIIIISIALLYSCKDSNKQYVATRQIIEVGQLETVAEAYENVKLIDVRKSEKYVEGHIPEALNIWRTDIQDTANYEYGGMLASKSVIERLFSDLGITNNDFLVLYDAKGQVDAARLWWLLDRYGYSNMALLNGGIQAWKRANLPISTKSQNVKTSSSFKFTADINNARFADKNVVFENITSKNSILVDCRSTVEFLGKELKKGAFRAGHIPRAVHIDFMECINVGGKKDCTFKTTEELFEIYNRNGIAKSDSIIIYCHSGVRSAHSTFVLTQLMGFTNVKNYDGSWIEWSYYGELPIKPLTN
ncbi:MAG: sulfurtransferase [Salibacteraceae bacterium]